VCEREKEREKKEKQRRRRGKRPRVASKECKGDFFLFRFFVSFIFHFLAAVSLDFVLHSSHFLSSDSDNSSIAASSE